jgi:hypothetical protein
MDFIDFCAPAYQEEQAPQLRYFQAQRASKIRTSRSSRPLTASVNFGSLCPAYRWVLFRNSELRLVSGG